MRQFGAQCSMLFVYGRHISTQAASMRFRWLAPSCVLKNSSRVSCLRSGPNHSGSPVSRIANHSDELHLFTKVDLVHTHLLQAILAPRGTPSLQIPQVDGAYRAGRHPELPGHLAYRCTFAGPSNGIFKVLA